MNNLGVIYQANAFAATLGVVAGLRSMTAPAVVSWAAHLGWIPVVGTPFGFIASPAAVAVFTLGAAAELVGDKLPQTPNRTDAIPLIARVTMGALSGAALSAGDSPLVGAACGVLGALVGTFAGFHARRQLSKVLPPLAAALVEDAVAIGVAYLAVTSH